jgi:hypothetical protein
MEGSSCIEHRIFMCNVCMKKEIARLKTVMGTIANILGGPVAAMSEELRSEERAERIDIAVKIISGVAAEPTGIV